MGAPGLGTPLTLPCGMVLPNRIYEAAMAESLATADGDPSPALIRLYRRWSNGGAGCLITGDIGVSGSAADARAVRVHDAGRTDVSARHDGTGRAGCPPHHRQSCGPMSAA